MKNSADKGECYSQRPKVEVPSEICRILHILQKLNSILLLSIQFIQNILKGVSPFHFLKPLNETSSPSFLGQQINNLQYAALLTSF